MRTSCLGLSTFFQCAILFKWAFYETSTLGNKFCDLKTLPRSIMSTKITNNWDGQPWSYSHWHFDIISQKLSHHVMACWSVWSTWERFESLDHILNGQIRTYRCCIIVCHHVYQRCDCSLKYSINHWNQNLSLIWKEVVQRPFHSFFSFFFRRGWGG